MKKLSHFDENAAQWDNNPTRVELARAVGAAITKAVPIGQNWRVLDYGAGTGLLTLSLQPLVGSILAMDSSAGMLEQLRNKIARTGISNIEICHWDLEKRNYAAREFDFIVSSMTFHHLRAVEPVLGRLAKVLKPGGWLAIADLDSEDGYFHADMEGVFHKGFARTEVAELLAQTGFNNVSVSDAHRVIKPDSADRLRTYGVFLAVGKKA
jgi:ubiquinone/menaquinone biosynthesis C-methylase UbiE